MHLPKPVPTFRPAFVVLGLLILLITLVSSMAWARASKTQLQQKNANLQRRISAVRQHIREVRKQEQQKAKQLGGVEHRVRNLREQLQTATRQLERTRVDYQRACNDLKDAESDFQTAQRATGTRLAAMYERGETGYLSMILAAADFGSLLRRAQLANLMLAQDRRALDDLARRRERVRAYQEQVADKSTAVSMWQTRVVILHDRADSERLHVEKDLTEVRNERIESEAELAQLERDSAQIAAMLRSMNNTSAGRRRYNATYAGGMGGLPTAGRITSGFGYRVHPVARTRRMHTGVDIAAPTGTGIYATGGGEVIYAGWRGGYGNTVIIDHGRGKATLYGHMSSIGVRAGQVVTRGQLIGRVGSTGISTGPHCHYEVRMNGTPVNPM